MRTLIAIAALLAVLSSCGSDSPDPLAGATPSTDAPTDTAPTDTAPETTTTEAASTADPYELYLTMAPADAPELTRDDAQLRAMLGCGTTWAPGTVDGALAEAYADLVEQWKAQGLCG